jgi:hypothetical protein
LLFFFISLILQTVTVGSFAGRWGGPWAGLVCVRHSSRPLSIVLCYRTPCMGREVFRPQEPSKPGSRRRLHVWLGLHRPTIHTRPRQAAEGRWWSKPQQTTPPCAREETTGPISFLLLLFRFVGGGHPPWAAAGPLAQLGAHSHPWHPDACSACRCQTGLPPGSWSPLQQARQENDQQIHLLLHSDGRRTEQACSLENKGCRSSTGDATRGQQPSILLFGKEEGRIPPLMIGVPG